MTKMTPWYDAATTCPDKPGVYEIAIGKWFPIGFSAWRDGEWHSIQADPMMANWARYETTMMAHYPGAQWRGFTERQEA